MRGKIAAKTLERWTEACSNHARVDKLLQQAAPFNHWRENAPADVQDEPHVEENVRVEYLTTPIVALDWLWRTLYSFWTFC
jgi:hypothetical protein